MASDMCCYGRCRVCVVVAAVKYVVVVAAVKYVVVVAAVEYVDFHWSNSWITWWTCR